MHTPRPQSELTKRKILKFLTQKVKKKFEMGFTEMKKQYILFLFLEAWAISSHIFHEITAWVLAPENTTWGFRNKLVLFKIIQHCFHCIKPVLTAYSLENILLFHFQNNSVVNSFCFLVVIAFSSAAIKPPLPPCFQLCCHRALSTQSSSASYIAQELRARFISGEFSPFCES